jgi:acyl-CoA reductase-like NAD-dependent aldehyde dehydrogenase
MTAVGEKPVRTTLIRSPYSGEVVDAVPDTDVSELDGIVERGSRAAKAFRSVTAYERIQIFHRAAELFAARLEDLARTITLEEGKPITEARGEVSRMPDMLRLCAFEGGHLRGETLPLDAHVGAQGKMGYAVRVPCGVVLAITPFNYPVLLVLHKLGPALAAGNAVILKPAQSTPLSALKIRDIFLEAGLPADVLQIVTGPGSTLGVPLCADPRIRKISFTGSTQVGEAITRIAGVKKLSLELGSNCAMVILPDADLEAVARATAVGGFSNAGQACISVQRIIAHRNIYGDFVDALVREVEAIPLGDPLQDGTRLASLISEQAAIRVQDTLQEAVREGADLVTGGGRDGAVVRPAVVTGVRPTMRLFREELFGPAVGVTAVDSVEEAIALTNDSPYGLGAGIFTRDLGAAFRFAQEAEAGNVMINWTPLWRADLMPYGGFKGSGIGKEGPRYAVEEMTELKTVVFHGLNH